MFSGIGARVVSSGTQAAMVARGALRWWSGELAGMVPPKWQAAYGRDPLQLTIVADVATAQVFETISALSFGAAEPQQIYLGEWPGAVAAVAQRLAKVPAWSRSIALLVPVSRCLERERSVPSAALQDIRRILALDIARVMPAGAGDVLFGWQLVPAEGRDGADRSVRQIIVKQSIIGPLVEDLSARGLIVDVVSAVTTSGTVCSSNMLDGSGQRASRSSWLRRASFGAIAATMVLAALTTGLYLRGQMHVSEQLAAQIATTRTKAQYVQTRLATAEAVTAQVAGLRLRKLEAISLATMWDDVSRILPDTAWLNELRVDGEQLVLDGYASSASELIGVFNRAGQFSAIKFASPVTRDPQSGMERFVLQMGTLKGTAAVGARP